MKVQVLDIDFDFTNSDLTKKDLSKNYGVRKGYNDVNLINVLNFSFQCVFEDSNNLDSKLLEMRSFANEFSWAWDDVNVLDVDALKRLQKYFNMNGAVFNFSFITINDANFVLTGDLNARKYTINNDGVFMENMDLISNNDRVII